MSVVPGSKPPALLGPSVGAPGGHPADPADREQRRALWRSGIPQSWLPGRHPALRIATHPLLWLSLGLIALFVYSAIGLFQTFVPDRELPNGTAPGLGTEAVVEAAAYARLTVIPLVLLLILADRFRTQRYLSRLWIWILTFCWGALVSTFLSAEINTWAAGKLSIIGDGDPSTAARAAIFVAPFVEEATKITVVFWIAILLRYRWVNRLGGLALAGISAAGFAFSENIIYYARAYRYAAQNIGPIEPEQALQQIFFVRGVVSFFAHPLFTIMAAIGLAVALRARSKVVRIMAPLAGFLGAALLHMAWNGSASVAGDNLLTLYFLIALPLLFAVVFFMIRQIGRESALLRARLGDYVVAGWLSEHDQEALSSSRRRLSAQWWGIFASDPDALPSRLIGGAIGAVIGLGVTRGLLGASFGFTLLGIAVAALIGFGLGGAGRITEHIRLGTELGYLRDAVTRGLVDEAGDLREQQILAEMDRLRSDGVTLIPTTPVAYPWRRLAAYRQQRAIESGSSASAPVGVGAGSAVDPSWAPPRP